MRLGEAKTCPGHDQKGDDDQFGDDGDLDEGPAALRFGKAVEEGRSQRGHGNVDPRQYACTVDGDQERKGGHDEQPQREPKKKSLTDHQAQADGQVIFTRIDAGCRSHGASWLLTVELPAELPAMA